MQMAKTLTAAGLCLAVAATGMMAGCEADASAPTRPRTRNVLGPTNGAQENAEHREEETQQRAVPLDRGGDMPGSGNAGKQAAPKGAPDARVATLMTVNLPQQDYHTDFYTSTIPHLSDKPPAHPTPGGMAVAGTPWVAEYSWGEGLPMQSYPHRDWGVSTGTYHAQQVKHNPTYYFFFQDFVPGTGHNTGTYAGNIVADLYEVPWFYVNTAILPALMVIQEPFAQVRTERLGQDPRFLGYLPGGPIAPSAEPGLVTWDYPFLRGNTETAPSGTQPDMMAPIAPTPGLMPVPQALTQPNQ